jgi:hypothetical protein
MLLAGDAASERPFGAALTDANNQAGNHGVGDLVVALAGGSATAELHHPQGHDHGENRGSSPLGSAKAQNSPIIPKEAANQGLSPAQVASFAGIFHAGVMGLHKDQRGTYYARINVPERLQETTARGLGNGKHKQVWLKRSLGTKRLGEANVRVKPVLIEFDQTLATAKEKLKARPVRTSLSAVEIKRMADYTYAYALSVNDAAMREAPEEEADQQRLTEEIDGPQEWIDATSEFGMSNGTVVRAFRQAASNYCCG